MFILVWASYRQRASASLDTALSNRVADDWNVGAPYAWSTAARFISHALTCGGGEDRLQNTGNTLRYIYTYISRAQGH